MFRIRRENGLLNLILLAFLSISACGQEIGTVTFLEGPLRMIRGASVMRAPEGTRVLVSDILESSSRGFVQVELKGGAVVALGPSTRVFFRSGVEAALLSGWLKGEVGPNAGTYRFASGRLAASVHNGAIVLEARSDAANLFVESGSAAVSSVSGEGYAGSPRPVKAGQFFSRRSAGNVEAVARPDPKFLDAVPRPFRDTLPSRLGRFAGKRVAPQRDHEVTYADVEPWLMTPLAWRKGFVGRFESRLGDAEFRKALEAHLNSYPEWDPVLHPEKYKPTNAPVNAESPAPQSRR